MSFRTLGPLFSILFYLLVAASVFGEDILLLTVDNPAPLGYSVTRVESMISRWSMADLPNYQVGQAVDRSAIPAAIEGETRKLLEGLKSELRELGFNAALGVDLRHSVGYTAQFHAQKGSPAEVALVIVTVTATPVRLEAVESVASVDEQVYSEEKEHEDAEK